MRYQIKGIVEYFKCCMKKFLILRINLRSNFEHFNREIMKYPLLHEGNPCLSPIQWYIYIYIFNFDSN